MDKALGIASAGALGPFYSDPSASHGVSNIASLDSGSSSIGVGHSDPTTGFVGSHEAPAIEGGSLYTRLDAAISSVSASDAKAQAASADAAGKLSSVDKQVLAIAQQLFAFPGNAGTALDELDQLVESSPTPTTQAELIQDVIPKLSYDSTGLFYLAGLVGDTQLSSAGDKMMTEILDEAETAPKGDVVSGQVLAQVINQEILYGHMTQSQARAEIVKAAASAGAGEDQWLMDAVAGLGGIGTIGKFLEPSLDETYYAISEIMSQQVFSGALATDLASEVGHKELTVVKAVAFGAEFGSLAMANKGWSGNPGDAALPTQLTQVDGVNEIDRAGLVLAQLGHKFTGANATDFNAAVLKSDVTDYLVGLGEYATMVGGKAVAEDLKIAENLLMTLSMPTMTKTSDSGATNSQMYATAKKLISKEFAEYLKGTTAVKVAVQEKAALGAGSVGAIASSDLATNGTMNMLIELGDKLLERQDFFPDNPIGDIGAIAEASQEILEDFGVGKLLGPFAGPVEGAINLVADASGDISDALNAAASLAVGPAVILATTPVFNVAENLSNIGKDLFTGNFSAVGSAAKALVDDLGNDIAAAGKAILQNIANDLDELEQAASQFASLVFNAIKNGVSDFINAIGLGPLASQFGVGLDLIGGIFSGGLF